MTSLDSSSLKFWELLAELGFIVVIFGVIGESAELLVKWGTKRQFRKWLNKYIRRLFVRLVKIVRPRLLAVETLFFSLLVAGLATEFLGSHKATHIADRDNARLNDRAANTESNNLALAKQVEQLHSTNLVLALKLQPRSDRLRQSGFKDFIKVKVSGEITVLYVPYNGEAAGFAVELYKELSQAGWKMTGFGPKPADLEPIWSSERLMVSESFASIAIVSHDDADASRLRWQSVPLDKTYGENGTNDIVLVEVKPPILDFSKPPPKDLLKEFRPTGRKDRYSLQLPPAGALAEALKKAGFHNEQQINPNLPPKKVIVVIGAKE